MGRQRSHLGLNKGGWGYCACAEVGAQEGGGCPRRALGLQAPAPPGCGKVVANRSVGDGRTVILELPPRAATEAAVSEVGSARQPLGPFPWIETGPGHQPHTGRLTRRSPGTGKAASGWRAAGWK